MTTALVLVDPHNDFLADDGAIWPAVREVAPLLRARAPGGEWYPPLAPGPGEIVAHEHWGLSGFAGTDLDQQLRQHGITDLVLAGLTAPGCVEGTGRYAMELGYSVTLVEDAVAAFTPEYQHAATHLTGPLYAHAVLPTASVLKTVSTRRAESGGA